MRASTHGLVINIIHSLCTCTKPALTDECKRLLRLSLDEFSLPRYYQLFGISQVQSATTTAFRSATRSGVTGDQRFSRYKSPSTSHNKTSVVFKQFLLIPFISVAEVWWVWAGLCQALVPATLVTCRSGHKLNCTLFPFSKNSLICLEGKSMTPRRGNTILFRSSQQLPRLRLGPSKGFLS